MYLLSFIKHNIYKDLDFYVSVRAYEKRVSRKQPLIWQIRGTLLRIVQSEAICFIVRRDS